VTAESSCATRPAMGVCYAMRPQRVSGNLQIVRNTGVMAFVAV
jgi:hypothetical protein